MRQGTVGDRSPDVSYKEPPTGLGDRLNGVRTTPVILVSVEQSVGPSAVSGAQTEVRCP